MKSYQRNILNRHISSDKNKYRGKENNSINITSTDSFVAFVTFENSICSNKF